MANEGTCYGLRLQAWSKILAESVQLMWLWSACIKRLVQVRSTLSSGRSAAMSAAAAKAANAAAAGDLSAATAALADIPPREEVPLPGDFRAAVDAALDRLELQIPNEEEVYEKEKAWEQEWQQQISLTLQEQQQWLAAHPRPLSQFDQRRPWCSKAFREGLRTFLNGLVSCYTQVVWFEQQSAPPVAVFALPV